jgi:hypothetical protein
MSDRPQATDMRPVTWGSAAMEIAELQAEAERLYPPIPPSGDLIEDRKNEVNRQFNILSHIALKLGIQMHQFPAARERALHEVKHA